MGGVFSSGSAPPSKTFIDFSAPQAPTDPNLQRIYDQSLALQKKAEEILGVIEGYTGCEDVIRAAMSKPQDMQVQTTSFEGLFPNVTRVKDFYQLGKDIDDICAKMIRVFIESEPIENHAALLLQFCSLLSFALFIDKAKMMKPAVQNDFSFYKRALGKLSSHPGIPANEMEANNISSFIAQATPIINSLINALDNLQRQIPVATFLANFAHICCTSVMMDKTGDPKIIRLLLTAMTISLVIYDHISPLGVFNSTQIQLKTCLSQLKLASAEDRGSLCDALQYTTRNYNKASDPIKKLITSR